MKRDGLGQLYKVGGKHGVPPSCSVSSTQSPPPTNFVNMKNVSRSSSNKKLTSCFRPEVVDFDPPSSPTSLHRSSSSRMSCLPLSPTKHQSSPSPKPTLSLLVKALIFHNRHNKKDHVPCRQGSKRRSFGGDRTIMNKASKTSGTKAESPPSCWSSSSESENSAKLDEEESRSEDISEKQKKSEWLGIFMVVLSLALTVMVGKCWGALLTSTWLYFFSLAKAVKEKKAKLSGRQVHVKKNTTTRLVGEGKMVGS